MAINKTAQAGTAGALMIIGMLLANMAYNDYSGFTPISDLDENGVYTSGNTFYIGDSVRFYLMPSLTSEGTGIEYFVWDFHDGDNIYTSTREDHSITHQFRSAGQFLVSVLALRGSASRIFTVPITILPSNQNIDIVLSIHNALEGETITFQAIEGFSNTPVTNFLWEFGDNGDTEIGKTVNHIYSEAGEYNIRVRGYSNNSLVYSAYELISVTNQVPIPSFTLSTVSALEDDNVSFSAAVQDTENDLESIRYIWEFGDTMMEAGANVSHIYPKDGSYEVKLHAIDDNGAIGTVSTTLQIENRVPTITQLVNERNFYSQGETITTYSNIEDSISDMGLLSYLWSIPGDGQDNSYPFFEVGDYTLNLTVTDDDSGSDTASTDVFHVINVNPYVSLLNATSSYDVTFRTWGTLDTDVNITFYQEDYAAYNLTMKNMDSARNASRIGGSISNLVQPLDQYWDIQIESMNNVTYDTYVETTFTFAGYSSISLVNHCTDQNSTCLASSYRFPVAPIDRGFPVTYTYSVFDPGNDDVTVTMDMGGNLFTSDLNSPSSGPTNGTLDVTAVLPYGILPSGINYYVTDEHGGASNTYNIPILDYSKELKPSEFMNKTSWNYFGYYIKQFAPNAEWNIQNEVAIGDAKTFMVEPIQGLNQTLNYVWHFGDGSQSNQRYPVHTYQNPGSYLLWLVIQNQYYSHAEFKWITVNSPIDSSYPIIQGMQGEGMNLNFLAAGLENRTEYTIHWDFGDGTTGFGNNYRHQYSVSGNYTARLTVTDRYNRVDYTDFLVIILNQAPVNVMNLQSFYEVAEGTNIIAKPRIEDSPYDLLHLTYSWTLDGINSNGPYVSILPTKLTSNGTLVVSDPEDETFSHNFVYNTNINPVEITPLQRYYLYGSTNIIYNLTGMLSPSVLLVNNYSAQTELQYLLLNKDYTQIDSGVVEYHADDFGFTAHIDTSSIANEATINNLKATLNSPEDLTASVSPSGTYEVILTLIDIKTQEIISKTSTIIDITLDNDGDFMTDELEILYSNSVDNLELDTSSTDTDNDGIADPVEYVLGEDADGDGLAKFYEDIYGTSDQNADTDGDGLTDGYGAFGELTHGTNPLDDDTDNDGLKDFEEIIGWQVQKVTSQGLEVISVTSNPLMPDTDGDGINDFVERNLGSNPNALDTDEDGLNDTEEQQLGISLNSYDSDGDGLPDFTEVRTQFVSDYFDVNGTKMQNVYYLNAGNPDTDNDGLTDYKELYWYNSAGSTKDTDSDGIEDYEELFTYHTRVDKADTDGDLLADGIELKGFDIPVTILSGGVYAEDLSVITEPSVTKYTLHVVTDPLLSDTDGDGLSDSDELFGDPANVGDPTKVDSDGDGILDQFDVQRLISDFEPAQIVSNIYITYSIQPSTAVKVASAYVYNYISNIISGAGYIAGKVLDYAWYWGSSCWWGICVYYPVVRSWWSIASYSVDVILSYIRNNPSSAFPTSGWAWLYTNTVNFWDFSFSFSKDRGGFPNGISVGGYATMLVQNPYSVFEGIVNPTINFLFDVQDNVGINNIKIYRNNVLVKDIQNIDRTFYTVNEYFSVSPSGFNVPSSAFRFEIYDSSGNVRIVERTTSVTQFTSGILQQGIRSLQDILTPLANAWNWVSDGFTYLGTQVVNAVVEAAQVVADTIEFIGNWIKAQFDNVWENFVRNTLTSLMRQYVNQGKSAMEAIDSSYLSIRDTIPTAFGPIVDGGALTTVIDAITEFKTNLATNLPSTNIEIAGADLGAATDAIGALFDGTVVADAVKALGRLATDILNKVVEDFFRDIIQKSFGPYQQMLMGSLVDIFSLVSGVLNDSNVALGSGSMGQNALLAQITGFLDSMTSPLTDFGSFLSGLAGNTLTQIIDFIFVDNPNVGTSFNDILHAMYSPLMAVGFALKDLFSLIPSNNLNLLEINSLEIKPDQLPELEILISVTKFIFKSGGIIYKDFFGNPADAADKKFDGDIEITDNFGSYFSPQFFGSIGLFINGAFPAVLSIIALELTSPDAATSANLERLKLVGLLKTSIAIFHMAVLGGLVAAGYRAHTYNDPPAVYTEIGIFVLVAAVNIYDLIAYTDIIATYAQPGTDVLTKSIELAGLYMNFIKDILVISTQNGEILPPNGQIAFQFFSIFLSSFRIVGNLLSMMHEVDHIKNG